MLEILKLNAKIKGTNSQICVNLIMEFSVKHKIDGEIGVTMNVR